MEREILFRGLKVDEETTDFEFVEGSLVMPSHPSCNPVIVTWEIEGHVMAFEKRTSVYYDSLGQYTGIKDKNRNKIFEGDIFNCWYGEACKVEWNKNRHNWSLYSITGDHCKLHLDQLDIDFYEIIGNIHQNPELLK